MFVGQKGSHAKRHAHDDEYDDDADAADAAEMTYHYDNERCDSESCKMPVASKVSWVSRLVSLSFP